MISRFLFVTYYFPPIHSVAVSRNYHIAKFLLNKISNHKILSTENRKIFLEDTTYNIENFEIELLKTFDYRKLLSKEVKQNVNYAETKKQNIFLQYLMSINDTFPFSLIFGEGGILYIFDGYRKANKYIGQDENLLIFTSFRTTSDIFIGWLLKRKFPNCKWWVDFRDLPINMNRKSVIPKSIHWLFWKKVLKRANLVTTLSNGLKSKLDIIFPKVNVFRSGIVSRKYMQSNREKFIINYTGSLYTNLQKVDLFFKAIKLLSKEHPDFYQNLLLTYAGKDAILWSNWIEEYELNEKAIIQNVVSRHEAMQLQDEAAINLLLTWSFPESKGIVTGKIYEYIAASKPILLLINGELDQEMEAWFDEMKCGKVYYNQLSNVENMQKYILEIYELWVNDKLATPYISEEIIQSMSWEHQLENILDEI